MLRLYHVLLGVILVPIGVTVASSYLSANKSSKPTPEQKPPIQNAIGAKSQKDGFWGNSLQNTTLPPGWKVSSCVDKKSLLCVSANEKLLGTVEMGIFPLETQLNFQRMLNNAGIPANSKVNYLSPKYIPQVQTALNAWVKNHYGVLAKSRQYVYDDKSKTAKTADGILFAAYPPQNVKVGNFQGVRYGFAGLEQKGGVREQHIGYVAFNGKSLYLINTAFNPTSSTAQFENLEDLSVFQPYLNTIVANLKLP